MLSTITAFGLSASDFLGLPEHRSGLGERTDLQHARLAGHDGEIGAQQQRPADLGVAARPIGNDVIRLLRQPRHDVEDLVGVIELNGADVRGRLRHPLGGGMLRVAVGEDHGVSLLAQPGRKVNRKRGFADTALGICHNNNHVGTHT